MKNVILLEDDTLLAVVQKKMLKALGYNVIDTLASGEEGLNRIQSLKPDIIVSDQNLIGPMKGLDVVKALRSSGDNTPVLILSGDTTFEHLKQTSDFKNVQPLAKPVKVEEFKEMLAIAEKSTN